MAKYRIEGEPQALRDRPGRWFGLLKVVLAAESVQALVKRLLDHLRHEIPFQQGGVTLLDFNAESATLFLSIGPDKGLAVVQQSLSRDVISSYLEDFLHGEAGVLVSVMEGQDPQAHPNFPRSESLIEELIGDRQEPIGVLHLGAGGAGVFDDRHRELVGEAADVLGLALPAVRRLEAAQLRKKELEFKMASRSAALEQQYLRRAALAEIELAINRPHELEGVLDRIAEVTTQLLPATGGVSVILWDSEREEFFIRSTTEPGETAHTVVERIRRTGGATRWIVDNRQPLLVEDVAQGPYGATRMLAELGYQAYAGLPLLVEGEVFGVLYAVDQLPRKYTTEDVGFLQSLANRAAVAISKVNLYEKLQAANQLLEEQSRELEAVNLELSDFAHIISHDLKAPLRGISSLAEWLAADYAAALDERGLELLEQLFNRVRRMHTLIDGVLQYSRAAQSESILSMVEVDALVREIIDLVSPPDHVTVQIEGYLPSVYGDEIRLRQVFQNLISNAVKYLDNDQGLIKISHTRHDQMWQFSVADNGRGIAARDHERIFQLFQTVTPKDSYTSTGIGLAVVKKIVSSWRGQVWLDSAPGEGSIFHFTLPHLVQPKGDQTRPDGAE